MVSQRILSSLIRGLLRLYVACCTDFLQFLVHLVLCHIKDSKRIITPLTSDSPKIIITFNYCFRSTISHPLPLLRARAVSKESCPPDPATTGSHPPKLFRNLVQLSETSFLWTLAVDQLLQLAEMWTYCLVTISLRLLYLVALSSVKMWHQSSFQDD